MIDIEFIAQYLLLREAPAHPDMMLWSDNVRILDECARLGILSAEDAEALKLSGENVVLLKYADGPYHNFDSSEKIAEGIYMLPAKGHTKGNSIVVAESDGLFYMMQGDVTYTDAALRDNKLSVIFEDLQAARETLEKVRTFVRENPTVYLSTHTPEACASLENKTVMKLD